MQIVETSLQELRKTLTLFKIILYSDHCADAMVAQQCRIINSSRKQANKYQQRPLRLPFSSIVHRNGKIKIIIEIIFCFLLVITSIFLHKSTLTSNQGSDVTLYILLRTIPSEIQSKFIDFNLTSSGCEERRKVDF